MRTSDFELLVAAEFRRFSPLLDGWRWGWMRSKRTFGQCFVGLHRIEFSKPLVETNSLEKCLDVIIHEMVHGILPVGEGHGPLWQKTMLEWGGDPSQFWNEASNPGKPVPFKWFGICGVCGYVVGRHRLTENLRSGFCPKCCDGVPQRMWRQDWKLRWMENNNRLDYSDAAAAIRELVGA